MTWDPWFVGTLLRLTLQGRAFTPERPNWAPVIGRIPVDAGNRYLLVVSLHGADWLQKDPFFLTTHLEP